MDRFFVEDRPPMCMAIRAEWIRRNTFRKKKVDELAVQVLVSMFDGSGTITDKMIDRINIDNSIPWSMKKEVYDRSMELGNKLLIELAKDTVRSTARGGGIDVGSKIIPSESEAEESADPVTGETDSVSG